MRELTVQERAAMWLYHKEYAAQALGAIEFYDQLSQYERRTVARMVKEIMAAATKRPRRNKPSGSGGWHMNPDYCGYDGTD